MSDTSVPKTYAELGFMQGSPSQRVVDISKWDKGEECRWAFQHISEFLPTANVSRGGGTPTVLPSKTRDLSRLQFQTPNANQMTIQEMSDYTYTDGLIVLHDGEVVYEKYYNGMTPHTRHLLMSVSKSVTGMLAGVLVNDGRLIPDKKVVDYIPEMVTSPGYAEATVREVLDMTTAIIFNEDYDDPNAEVVAHEVVMAWRGRSEDAMQGIYAFAQTIKKTDREHGEAFHYASINTDVLGWLIERASGQRFAEFMSQMIWSKLGAEHDAQITVDFQGSPAANGGFCITLRDLARFGQMMLDNGYYNGQQIISSGWIDDIRFHGNNAAWKQHPVYPAVWPDGFYRNQWYITGDDQGSYFAVGVNGQHIWINPTTRTVIVKFSSGPVSADYDRSPIILAGLDALARSLS